jgi:hypothetical protein
VKVFNGADHIVLVVSKAAPAGRCRAVAGVSGNDGAVGAEGQTTMEATRCAAFAPADSASMWSAPPLMISPVKSGSAGSQD